MDETERYRLQSKSIVEAVKTERSTNGLRIELNSAYA